MNIPSIAPGGSAPVVLQLTPPADLTLGDFTGTIGLNARDLSLGLPFTFRSVSAAAGDLSVTVEDEYTYFADAKPNLTGATVTITDPRTGQAVRSGTSDRLGRISFAGLAEGYYKVDVTAEQHNPFAGTVLVSAGEQSTVRAFLSRNLVTYNWTVVPIAAEDRTEVTLQTTFEANVPAPVITVSPGTISLSALENVGDLLTVDLVVRNLGLIAASDIVINFDTHPHYTFTPLVARFDNLPARSSVTVPLIIRRIVPKPTSAADISATNPRTGIVINDYVPTSLAALPAEDAQLPCGISGGVRYEYRCGSNKLLRVAPIGFTDEDRPRACQASWVPPGGQEAAAALAVWQEQQLFRPSNL